MLLYARRGSLAAVATFMMTLLAALAAFNYYPLIEHVLLKIYRGLGPYADALGLMIAFLAAFFLLQYLAIRFLEEHIKINAVVNGAAGALFGGMAGLLLGGMLVICWLMMPGSSYYLGEEGSEPAVFMNADNLLLNTVRFMSNERINGSAPFDPAHSFMKSKTYKMSNMTIRSHDGRPRRPQEYREYVNEEEDSGRPGMAGQPNLRRSEIEDDLTR